MSEQAMIKQFNQGDHDAAIRAAVQRIDDKPTDPKRYAVLATMLIGIHAFDEASQLLVRALGLFPNHPELTYDAGLLAFSQENFDLASKYFKQLAQGQGNLQTDAQYMLALSEQHAGRTQKALAYALTAHEAAPEKVDAALLAAQLLLGFGAFSDASCLLKPFLKMKDVGVLFTYGMAQTGAGIDGQKWLDEAKALDPKGYQSKVGQVRDIAGFLKAQGQADE
ncbi:tetratricopeptide repeat protein [Lacticaseibacillus salsurivasis]|uniref:tetratricopeptide repeat protein n=1 Tax=Lacticaseibacillus salsurivasis TaxID=3081441 RepID=UPI0030C6D9F9